MFRSLLLFTLVVLTFTAAPVSAQYYGSIDVTSDPGGTNCTLPDSPSIPFYIYVVARPHPAAPDPVLFGADFDVDVSPYFTYGAGLVLSEYPPGGEPHVGSIGSGVSVSLGVCASSPTVLLYVVQMVTLVPIGVQRYVSVGPHPTYGLNMYDCVSLFLPHPVAGGQGVINGTCSIGVRETTWGKLKALYSD